MESEIKTVKQLVAEANTILILQPDNADGDSMGSALGLEEIIGDLGKEPYMYSYKEPESYLHTLEGWDRVSQKFPKAFDLAILVDTASSQLLTATYDHHGEELIKRPIIVIDHHMTTEFSFDVAVKILDSSATSTGEQVVQLAQKLDWPISSAAAQKLTSAILSDSLNLTVHNTSASTVQSVADMVKLGANLNELATKKREASALSAELLGVKAKLLAQVEYFFDGRLALCGIDAETMNTYKDEHDPADLIIWEMQWVKGVEVAAVLKHYGTKIKVSMRAKRPIADKIANSFDGGGHARAAAFRATSTDMAIAKKALVESFGKISGENPDV